MDDLFGGSLVIRDAFSTTFSIFNSSISSATNSFKMFNNAIGQSERANRQATQSMKQQIAQLAQTYVEQGYTMQQAIKRATSEVERQSPTTGNAWADTFGRIKQVGVDAFGSINSKIQSFSNSTLGMISKITLGFTSLKTVMSGLKTGFNTAMQYQDSRMTLDTLYGSKKTGGEKFKMATDYANKTPWEESETVGALVKLKAYGLDDSEQMMTLMSDLGSTFKSMGQNMDTATEAYADMMNGQWERMTQFGLKRETLDKFAKDKGMKAFDNKKGQITDKVALANVFKAYMDDKNYTGMTDKLGETASGKMSTMSGNLKKSLAELVGIANDGSVRSGSLFEKFINGMQNFITKMNSFTESANFNKISNALGVFGGAISDGFSYLMDHPEVAESLLKLSAGIWALGKISAVIEMFTTISGAFGAGGLLSVLSPLTPEIFALVGSFLILKSIFSPEGMLHKGISWLIGKIPLIGVDLQKSFEVGSIAIQDFFTSIWNWIKSKFGFETKDNTKDKVDNNWYDGKGNIVGTIDKDLQYKTASNALKDGTISKVNANRTITNKTDIHLNVDTIKETADVDELMDTVTKRMDKYSQTRNNLD